MHAYPDCFPQRHPEDKLDCAPLIVRSLVNAQAGPRLFIEGVPVSGGETAQRIAQLRRWLYDMGLQAGDHVAVMCGNHVDHIHLIYALIVSGIVWVPVNTRLRGAGLAYLIEHSRPALLVVDEEFAGAVDAAGLRGIRRERPPSFLASDENITLDAPNLEPDHTLCIIYTSGTTGAPKGVVFTHRMMRIAGEAVLQVADVRGGDRLLLWEPLCHIGGAQILLLPFLENIELHVVPRFSASRFWDDVARARATHLHYLGGVLDILMQLPEEAQPRNPTLRVAWGAGVGATNWRAIEERLHVRLRECYGMTECSSFATLNRTDKPGSIGRPLPWLDVDLLDDHGNPVAPGEPGEIVLTSRVEGALLPCYLDNEEATRSALREGRLHTGDWARRDGEGDLFFVGRRTDSMRVRGENVSAWEIERIFASHPAIRASAAIGVPSPIGEQDILLNVQFKDEPVDWPSLHAWARKQLASYQLPRYYRAIAQFDMTPSERVRKHMLSRDLRDVWDSGTLK
ncbi:crotonobetaine/carnitine-CoA ligase [Trinickia symbiotica]|uniref:AMP-dependent synthetase n=1 Tax=Trinickia symbiotica TaxID=863227 RepID=A0A2N7XB46_9BURK|nr:AMP-binding protein [Trinickia symbiotica]PMS38830.1 AMP-dependent synthetase [Trinickia symbiotica]PPK46876.1 crotonobetaine/carnitine-CoA ligase [Trinickia symbiotica]